MQKTPTSFEKVILLSIDRKIKKKKKRKRLLLRKRGLCRIRIKCNWNEKNWQLSIKRVYTDALMRNKTIPGSQYKIRWCVWWKKSPGSLYAFQVICCLKNWNSIFISTPYPAGIKPYKVGIKTLVHIIYLGKYGWVEPFSTTLQERWLVEMSPSNLGWPTACGILHSCGVVQIVLSEIYLY